MPALSVKQKNFMGMAHAIKKGAKIPNASVAVKKAAKTMKAPDLQDFASTPIEGLPKTVKRRPKGPIASHAGDTFKMYDTGATRKIRRKW